MIKTLFHFIFIFAGITLAAQDITWRESQEPSNERSQISPAKFRTVSVDFEQLKAILLQAPKEGSSLEDSNFSITLPVPDGGFARFTIVESSTMAPSLQLRYPDIRTFMGYGHGDYANASVRLDFTLKGFHAQVLMPENTFYIDPFSISDLDVYMVYTREAFFATTTKTFGLCLSGDQSDVGAPSPEGTPDPINTGGQHPLEELDFQNSRVSNGTSLRTYQLALACTAEYTAFHGGTTALALSAMTTTMNRVNGIYVRDLSLRMLLIPDNDDLIYFNVNTDPYTNGNTAAMTSQNQSNINAEIGSSNYDIGHVLGTSTNSGLASVGVVCNNGSKSRGVTLGTSPMGDPFDVDYVAHEMGHQWGATHTQNNNCNRTASSAYEPGSGSTIMGYAGICSPNLQSNSGAYFHNHSYNQIRTFSVAGTGNGCASTASSGNTPPTISVPSSGFFIPRNTPFELTATASDPNSDPLTYCWEQYDLGSATAAGDLNLTAPSGNQPMFRSWPPSSNSTRVFPRLSSLVNNITVIGEILPSYARDLTFRCTVRDGDPAGGGVNDQQVSFDVASSSGPFLVTSPNTSSASWVSGTTQTVTWNTANTAAAPVSCSNVDIFLSTDGGFTFSTLLLGNTPNDGSASITVPNVPSNQARIKVKARFNIFFDISNQNFSITQPSATNDNVCSATTILCGQSLNGSSLTATVGDLTSPACASGSVEDVFYKFNATANSTYTITCNGPNYDAVLALYSGFCGGTLTELACVDNGLSSNIEETITFSSDQDQLIFIQTYDWADDGGNFTISLSCEFGNDDPCGAVPIACGQTIFGSTVGATQSDIGLPSCGAGSQADLWYSFTSGLGFSQTITVNGANFDGILAAYTGSCNGTLSEIACTDNGLAPGIAESLVLAEDEGTIIYIQLYDWGASAGEFELSLNCSFENDDICNAIEIECGENINGSTIGATPGAAFGSPECSPFGSQKDVFFQIDAQPSQEYTVVLSGEELDGILVAYNGGDCLDDLTEIACSDILFEGNDETISFSVQSAETVWIRAYDFAMNGAEFNIEVSCEEIFDCPSLSANFGDPCSDGDPATTGDVINTNCDCEGIIVPNNDLCTDAQVLSVNIPGDCPINEVTGTTIGATSTDGYTCETLSPDVFYTINSGSFSVLELTLVALTASDLVLNVYESCSSSTGEVINCAIGTNLDLELNVDPNSNYIIRIHSLDAPLAGTFNICVQGIYDCPGLNANLGDSCDDGNASTQDDTVTDICDCVGIEVFDCPALSANIGDACNDSNANTINDVVTAGCNCEGTAIPGTLSGTAIWNSDCGSRNMSLKFYTPGTALLFTTVNTTISGSGNFSVSGIPSGTYDVFVKVDGFLQKGFADVLISTGGTTLNIGVMINGDINNSNGINIADLTVISSVFGLEEGNAAYNPAADVNCSGGVNISDLTIVSSNFGTAGDVPPLSGL